MIQLCCPAMRVVVALIVVVTGCGPGLLSHTKDGGSGGGGTSIEDAGGGDQSLGGGPTGGGAAGGSAVGGGTAGGGSMDTCSANQHACVSTGTCANDDDADHCGTDCVKCLSPANASRRCASQVCRYGCPANRYECSAGCCRATAVFAGSNHTCALLENRELLCWGAAAASGAADYFTDRLRPGRIAGLAPGVVAATGGLLHSCALFDDGGVQCWGINSNGSLGNNSTAPSLTPVIAGPMAAASSVSASANFTCAIAAGAAMCWGSGTTGEQGNGDTFDRHAPGAVSGLNASVASIATGYNAACATLAGGEARCWGQNTAGKLGANLPSNSMQTVPVTVAADAGIAQIFPALTFACAVSSVGQLLCWGANGLGQLGDGTSNGTRPGIAATLPFDAGILSVASGGAAEHSCVGTVRGAMCWGNNDHGQVGDGTVSVGGQAHAIPTPVVDLHEPVVSMARGASHTCAVTQSGGVYCWGLNDHGQLGDGTTTPRFVPTLVR